jgi:hypothetical protein
MCKTIKLSDSKTFAMWLKYQKNVVRNDTQTRRNIV